MFDFLRGNTKQPATTVSGPAKAMNDLDDLEDSGFDLLSSNSTYGNNDLLYNHWIEPEVHMPTLMSYYKTAYLLGATVDAHTEHSVGNSYNITADTGTKKGKQALDIIKKAAHEMNLEKLNRQIAQDMWLSGNWFGTKINVHDGGAFEPPQALPLSAFSGIWRDEEGEVTKYRKYIQTPGVDRDEIAADQISHFGRNHQNASPWGTGLGQMVCRRGIGYKDSRGKTIKRPALVEIWEMLDDVLPKTAYAGLPRYFVSGEMGDETATALSKILQKLNPLQAVAINAKGAKVEAMGLNTQNRFNDVLQRVQNSSIISLQNPTIQLWTSMSFTYASSKEAMEALMPLIMGYERDHKRFVEQEIFRPIIDKALGPQYWDKVNIELNWGQPDTLDLDSIETLTRIASYPIMQSVFDPMDIIAALKDTGLEINPLKAEKPKKEQPKSKVAGDDEGMLKHLDAARAAHQKKQRQQRQDEAESKYVQLLDNLNRNYGWSDDNAG